MNHSIEIPILQQWLPSTTMATKHNNGWIPAKQQLADCLTKQGTSSLNLARAMENGRISQ